MQEFLHHPDVVPKAARSKEQREKRAGLPPADSSLFHQHWWLGAVTKNAFEEITVGDGAEIAGRLPYWPVKRHGFTQFGMPPFTHVLGPIVTDSPGKQQTQLLRRMSIIRELIEKLPRHDYFNQTLPDANIDALAFQELGFQARCQYTFEVDCRRDVEALWSGMHFKVRQHIRRAGEKLEVLATDDPEELVYHYNRNLQNRGRTSYFSVSVFPALYEECRKRDCCEILRAKWPDGTVAAMIALVWDTQRMFYLVSTHARTSGDNGSVNLLIWSAIQRAHQRGLRLDLDGVTTVGTARFLSGFGGEPKLRTVVRRSGLIHGLIQGMRDHLAGTYFA